MYRAVSHIHLLRKVSSFVSSLFFRVFFRAKMRGFDDQGSHGGDVINIHPEHHLFPYIALWQRCHHRRRCYHLSCRSFFIGPVPDPVDASAILPVEARRRLGVSHTLKPDVNPITKARNAYKLDQRVRQRPKVWKTFRANEMHVSLFLFFSRTQVLNRHF